MALELASVLDGMDYRPIRSEQDLQSQVELRLVAAGVDFESQWRLNRRDRPDIRVGSIAIELKTKGSVSSVLSQIERYMLSEKVSCVLLVTTRASHLELRKIVQVHGKPLYVVYVGSL